jgi:CheY-like chemotaxis protein
MTAIRLLHVDDEPDIREVVEISLALDPDFEVQSCTSGRDALVMAAEWKPDLVLLDVMMPEMDGLTTLAHLRDNPRTTDIPVLFMTARVQAHEIERFRAIGAQGVIAKPFEPLTLAASIKRHIQLADVQIDPRRLFLNRARDEVASLESYKTALSDRTQAATAIEYIESAARRIADAAPIGFEDISARAQRLEQALEAQLAGKATMTDVIGAIDALSEAVVHR